MPASLDPDVGCDPGGGPRNRTGFRSGWTSHLFSHDLRIVETLSAAIHAGGVIVNDWAASYPEAPFGGIGDSGIGTEGGVEGLQAFQKVKFVSRRA